MVYVGATVSSLIDDVVCVKKERGAYDLLSRSAAAVSEITPHVSRIDDV